jgi:hypothetical protein
MNMKKEKGVFTDSIPPEGMCIKEINPHSKLWGIYELMVCECFV